MIIDEHKTKLRPDRVNSNSKLSQFEFKTMTRFKQNVDMTKP